MHTSPLTSHSSVKSEHVLRPDLHFPQQPPGLYPDKMDLQDQDSHLYGSLGKPLFIHANIYS